MSAESIRISRHRSTPSESIRQHSAYTPVALGDDRQQGKGYCTRASFESKLPWAQAVSNSKSQTAKR